jgi:hypothetical protein
MIEIEASIRFEDMSQDVQQDIYDDVLTQMIENVSQECWETNEAYGERIREHVDSWINQNWPITTIKIEE